ncbi:MAG: hypothetical protein RIA65_05555, partial [Woeseia sp.]
MIKNIATAIALTLLTASCATGVPRGETTERSIQAAMEEARAPAPALPVAAKPDPVSAGPSPPIPPRL